MRHKVLLAGLVALVAALGAASTTAAPSGPAATPLQKRFKVPLPGAGKQRFAVLIVRGRLKPGVRRPAIRLRALNGRNLPPDIRAAGAVRKPIRRGRITTIRAQVAINNLATPQAGPEGTSQESALDLILEGAAREWGARPLFGGYLDIDECPDDYDDEVEQAQALFLFFTFGLWPSPPWSIYRNTIRDARTANPLCF